MSMRPSRASGCGAAPGSGPWPPRPSRPRPIASCGRTGRRREEQAAGALCPPGTIHLPDWADGEWLKQLTAEQLVTVRTKRGFARLEWQKLRERNEALDCRVYARAAAWIAGADRWPEARWADLEAQLGVARQDGSEAGPATSAFRPDTHGAAPAHGALELHEVIHGHGRRAPRTAATR
jgi:hypothetical protein